MYKVLIVDDELIIRNGLYSLIPWAKLGIEHVYTASCAQEALEIARETRPDIMLTDICMPEMDGLEMTRLMFEILPKLRVIVLTGYDDFKYAQKSCSLGVKDFILKPVDEGNLIKCIELQLTHLQNETQAKIKDNILSRKRMLEEQRKLEESLMELTEKPEEHPEIIKITDKLSLEDNCEYQVVLIKPEIAQNSVWSQHKNLLLMSIKSFFINMIDSNNSGWTFQNKDRDIIVIFYVSSKYSKAEDQISKLKDIIDVEFEVMLNVGIGPKVSHIAKINYSYNEAKKKCNKEDFTNNLNIPIRGNGENFSNSSNLFFYKEKILENIHDTDIAKRYLKSYLDEVKSLNIQKSSVEQMYYDLAAAFYWEYLKATGNSVDGRLEAFISTLQNNDVENCSVFTEMFIVKLMYSNKKQMHEIIEAATKLINEHFTEDLTVFTLAERFHVARNYFSRLFKKEMGEGCNEYITRKRIEMAKQLLADQGLRTYEIADQVGYHDTNYFSLAFKKNTGLSPKEYREKLNNPK